MPHVKKVIRLKTDFNSILNQMRLLLIFKILKPNKTDIDN